MQEKFQKIALVLEIMTFEPVPGTYFYYEEN